MYFTVNTLIKIEGKPYRPCVCYKVESSAMELTLERLCREGKAQKHEQFVFFCNGKPVEQKAEKFEPVEKPAKKVKAKKVAPKDFAKEVEEVVTPSVEYETKEDTEDF